MEGRLSGRGRKPRLMDPSSLRVPRSVMVSGASLCVSEPSYSSAHSPPLALGTTRLRLLMIDFFMLTGLWTPCSL
jgi:hypothetical protein